MWEHKGVTNPQNTLKTQQYFHIPLLFHYHSRSLTTEHLPLLARMVEVAKTVLKEGRGNPDDVRMGFHLPPFLRVSHLHMHIISPASRMSWLNRNIVFRKDSFAFVSPTGAISYLKKWIFFESENFYHDIVCLCEWMESLNLRIFIMCVCVNEWNLWISLVYKCAADQRTYSYIHNTCLAIFISGCPYGSDRH